MSVVKRLKYAYGCVYKTLGALQSPYIDIKSLCTYRGGFMKPTGALYTHIYVHFILFPRDTGGASQSPKKRSFKKPPCRGALHIGRGLCKAPT